MALINIEEKLEATYQAWKQAVKKAVAEGKSLSEITKGLSRGMSPAEKHYVEWRSFDETTHVTWVGCYVKRKESWARGYVAPYGASIIMPYHGRYGHGIKIIYSDQGSSRYVRTEYWIMGDPNPDW